MAQLLHSKYGFSYDKLQVLLGGWHAWQNANYPSIIPTVDPKATTAPAAPAGANPAVVTVVVTPKP